MNTKRFSPWLAALLALTLAALACGGGATPEPSATPFPKPTQKPAATATPEEPTQAPQPTKPPKPTATEKPEAAFEISAEAWEHSSGVFSINLPEGWEPEERSDGIYAESPDKVASLDVSFTNVGTTLDDQALDNYIEAIESNWFGGFKNYQVESKEPQQDGSILVLKTLQLKDGTPQTVFSYYWHSGTVVYEQDFWVDSDQYDAYADSFVEVANTIKTSDDAAGQAPLYEFTANFTGPSDLYQFRVPYGWTYTYNESDDQTTTSDTFSSPDSHAVIQALTYDNGQTISKSDAGQIALVLLKQIYGFSDIKVVSDAVQPNGTERLTWTSASSGVIGETFFESRGTTFIVISFIADTDFTGLYAPVWENLVSTWTIP